jgi:hypothetical protein
MRTTLVSFENVEKLQIERVVEMHAVMRRTIDGHNFVSPGSPHIVS